METPAVVIWPYSKSTLKRPAESIDALEPDEFCHCLQTVAGQRKVMPRLGKPQFFDKMRRCAAKDLFKAAAKMSS